MNRRLITAVLAVSAVSAVFAGCRAKEALDKASIATDLKSRGALDVMKEASNDRYTPPADGRLTDGQVQMYLKVRDHEREIAQVARQQAQAHADEAKKAGEKSITGMMEGFKTLGAVADIATADVRAAKDLHYNTAEYLWVKGQILGASVAAMTDKMSQSMNSALDAQYEQMKKAAAEAKDDTTRKMYADMMASYEKQKQESAQSAPKVDAAVTYNRQLLSRYENALNALGSEMAKWEDKPGEAQKSMEQFNKDMDKAAQDAKAKQ